MSSKIRQVFPLRPHQGVERLFSLILLPSRRLVQAISSGKLLEVVSDENMTSQTVHLIDVSRCQVSVGTETARGTAKSYVGAKMPDVCGIAR